MFRIIKGCIAALLCALSGGVSASNEPFTCSELAVFAYGVTVARDKGTSLSRTQQIISEDSSFIPKDKAAFKKLVVDIYSARSIDADTMAAIANKECLKTGKRKP